MILYIPGRIDRSDNMSSWAVPVSRELLEVMEPLKNIVPVTPRGPWAGEMRGDTFVVSFNSGNVVQFDRNSLIVNYGRQSWTLGSNSIIHDENAREIGDQIPPSVLVSHICSILNT